MSRKALNSRRRRLAQYVVTRNVLFRPQRHNKTHRAIFLYSSYKQTGYLDTHTFHKEFYKKTRKHFYKNTPEYTKHIELIHALSF